MSKASDHFHQGENLNCAQAVLRHFGAAPELLAEYRTAGGGRAPEGVCGALYAARQLLDDEARYQMLLEEFRKASGDETTCRGIKGAVQLPCACCVDLAAELVGKLKNR